MYERTHDTNAVIVQAGWQLYTRDAEELGMVVAADQQRIVVTHGDERWQFATDLLREQEEAEMRASLDISAEQAARVAERV